MTPTFKRHLPWSRWTSTATRSSRCERSTASASTLPISSKDQVHLVSRRGATFGPTGGRDASKMRQTCTAKGHLRWDSLGEFLALAVSLDDLAEKTDNAKLSVLAKTLRDRRRLGCLRSAAWLWCFVKATGPGVKRGGATIGHRRDGRWSAGWLQIARPC